MSSRWYNVVVVLFWIATMSWLVATKIMPAVLEGDPPAYRPQQTGKSLELPLPVAWEMFWDKRPIGRATTRWEYHPQGGTEIVSQVYVRGLPLAQVTPAWLKPLLRFTDDADLSLDLDAQSRLALDVSGNLVSFHSTMGPSGAADAIVMHGVVRGRRLAVKVRSGDLVYDTETYVPPKALVSDALSPRDMLNDVHLGQSWTVPVYSPFRPANSPLEVMHARVEREEILMWRGAAVNTLLIVYRSAPGAGGSKHVVGRAWVRGDGAVLKQELAVLNSRLVFVRDRNGLARQGKHNGEKRGDD